MKLTDAGIELIKGFENLRLKAYDDATGRTVVPGDPVKGVVTIGWGHIQGVTPGMECTLPQAREWLDKDISYKAELPLRGWLANNNVALNDNQYSALVSLIFNCGDSPLYGHLGTYLIAKNEGAVADEILKWNHDNGKVIEGLTIRRKAERKMFLTIEEPK